jgi:guanosine-3',5'-bis(diphosphate) 3'-pyrophosphohydrolase
MQVQKIYQQAIVFATERHAQKNQKIPGTDLPYVVHLSNVAMELFVASSANDQLNLEFAVQVALLHDLIEDTDTTCEEIEARFGVEIMRAVKALTKNKALPKDQQLPDSIARIKKLQPDVWAVKLADRITNLQPPPSHWDNEKRIQYQREARMILNELKQGNDYLANRLKLEIEKYGNYINK